MQTKQTPSTSIVHEKSLRHNQTADNFNTNYNTLNTCIFLGRPLETFELDRPPSDSNPRQKIDIEIPQCSQLRIGIILCAVPGIMR